MRAAQSKTRERADALPRGAGNLSPENIFAAVRHKTSTALDSVHDTSHTSQDDARLRGAITAMIQAADDNQAPSRPRARGAYTHACASPSHARA